MRTLDGDFAELDEETTVALLGIEHKVQRNGTASARRTVRRRLHVFHHLDKRFSSNGCRSILFGFQEKKGWKSVEWERERERERNRFERRLGDGEQVEEEGGDLVAQHPLDFGDGGADGPPLALGQVQQLAAAVHFGAVVLLHRQRLVLAQFLFFNPKEKDKEPIDRWVGQVARNESSFRVKSRRFRSVIHWNIVSHRLVAR